MKTRWYNKNARDVEDEWDCWRNADNNKHTWAFIHYLKRQGDEVAIRYDEEMIDIAVKRAL